MSAGVPGFVPSDFSLDHTTIRDGSNRNLQLRRDFRSILDAAPVRATSVLNGAFADVLTGVAAYTAHAALDRDAPRFLRIAGDTVSSRNLAGLMTGLCGEPYCLLYAGRIGPLRLMARTGQALSGDSEALYSAWQGMQYFGNMFSGDGAFHALDNDRYGLRTWTSVREVLEGHRRAEARTDAAA